MKEWCQIGRDLAGLQTCHTYGHHSWRAHGEALRRQAALELRSELEEVVAAGDQVILVMHTPGLDKHRGRQAGDRTYDVVTVRGGRIVELHACRDHSEARELAGIG